MTTRLSLFDFQSAVSSGRARIRLASGAGLSVDGRACGRYPLDPHRAAE
jgi:hypothetical protein